MSTNGSSPNFLLQVTLCNTPEPSISRILSVPCRMSFTELHDAIGVVFGWNVEPCSSWAFKRVDQTSLPTTKSDDPKKPKQNFTVFWMVVGKGYTPAKYMYGTEFEIGQHMNRARAGKYWTYDYNISNQPHAIKVLDTRSDGPDPAPELICVGGFGQIDRNLWQFAAVIGCMVKGLDRNFVCDVAALNVKLREIQKRFEEKQRLGAANVAVESKDNPKKRAAPFPESRSAEEDADEDEGPLKKSRVTSPETLIPDIQQ